MKDDLISRQADLITKIQNGIKATDADDVYSCGMRNGMRWCKFLIDGKEPLYENYPSARSEPKSYRMGYQAGYAAAQRWIPCKTRKPEKSGLYLVTKQQKTGEIQLATAHYNTAFDEWSGNGNFKKVLAWQPLPSPWKGSHDAD